MAARPLRIVSLSALRGAWRDSKDSSPRRRSAGVDRITPAQFRVNLDENLKRLRARLLQPGFESRPLKPVLIPKTGNRFRVICVPTVEDRLVQRTLLRYLVAGDKLKIKTPVSYGFVEGRGIHTALNVAKKIRNRHPWVLKSDIASFFDQIDRGRLKHLIVSRLRRSSIIDILAAVIETEIACDDERDRKRIADAGIVPGRGLRQGMPLSPMLSNLVLRDFDLQLCARKFHLVRYADDFVIFGDSQSSCMNALTDVSSLLKEVGHRVPELLADGTSKTKLFAPDEAVEFLGFEIWPAQGSNYEIAVPQMAFEELKKRVRPFGDFGTASKKWMNFGATITSLNSTIDGFINAYRLGRNFKNFQSHAANCRKQAIEDLLSAVLGPEVLGCLDPARRRFLGILVDDETDESLA